MNTVENNLNLTTYPTKRATGKTEKSGKEVLILINMIEKNPFLNSQQTAVITQFLTPVIELIANEVAKKIQFPTQPQETPKGKVYAKGLPELAEHLGCSVTTVWRLKKSGQIDSAISQWGHTIVFDVEKILNILSLKKGRK